MVTVKIPPDDLQRVTAMMHDRVLRLKCINLVNAIDPDALEERPDKKARTGDSASSANSKGIGSTAHSAGGTSSGAAPGSDFG